MPQHTLEGVNSSEREYLGPRTGVIWTGRALPVIPDVLAKPRGRLAKAQLKGRAARGGGVRKEGMGSNLELHSG